MKYHGIVMAAAMLLLTSCSAGDEDARSGSIKDHVWKDKTDMLEKAGKVNELIEEADSEYRRALDNQAR